MVFADVQIFTADTAAGGAAVIKVLRTPLLGSLPWQHVGPVRKDGQVVVNAIGASSANPTMRTS
jgi:hypothetical protein